jgi:hypothetical protein
MAGSTREMFITDVEQKGETGTDCVEDLRRDVTESAHNTFEGERTELVAIDGRRLGEPRER